MTYGCVAHPKHAQSFGSAAVSHLAELVRGHCSYGEEGPLIRPFGPPYPQGEKGRSRLSQNNARAEGGPAPSQG